MGAGFSSSARVGEYPLFGGVMNMEVLSMVPIPQYLSVKRKTFCSLGEKQECLLNLFLLWNSLAIFGKHLFIQNGLRERGVRLIVHLLPVSL